MKRLLIGLLLVFMLALYLPIPTIAHQETLVFSLGQQVLVQVDKLEVHTSPGFDTPIATRLPHNLLVQITAGPIEQDGVNWWYVADSAFGWIPESIEGEAAINPYTPELLDQLITDLTLSLSENPNDASLYSERAMAFYSKQNYENAVSDFSEAIALTLDGSDEAWLYSWRGKCLLDWGNNDEKALEDFDISIRLYPLDAMTHIRRGIALENMGGRLLYENHQTASELVPQWGLPYMNMGSVLISTGQYNQAIQQLTYAVQVDPYTGYAYMMRGYIYERLDDPETALINYDEAINVNPYDPEFYRRRGLLRFTYQGDYNAAMKDIEKAINLDPQDASNYYSRSVIYTWTGQLELALADLKESVRLDPNNTNAIHDLAGAAANLGYYQDALESYTILSEEYPSMTLYTGQLSSALGDYERALRDLNNYLEMDREYDFTIVGHVTRGTIYMRLGNYVAASGDFAKAFATDYDATVVLNTWIAGYRAPNQQELINDYLLQTQADPNNASVYFELAILYLETGDWFSALDMLYQYRALTARADLGIDYLTNALEATINQTLPPIPPESLELQLGTNLGEISAGGNQIWVYNGRDGDDLRFIIRADGDGVNTDSLELKMNVYRADGVYVTTMNSAGTGEIGITLQMDGTYRFEIQSRSQDLAGRYSISLRLLNPAPASTENVVVATPTTTFTPTPTLTPEALGTAQLGENRGEIPVGGSDIWTYDGKRNETISIEVFADQPASGINSDEERERLGVLDVNVTVRSPSGAVIAFGEDIVIGTNTDSQINSLQLLENGSYEIEVSSWKRESGGAYTLILQNDLLPQATPTIPVPTSTPVFVSQLTTGVYMGEFAVGGGQSWFYEVHPGENVSWLIEPLSATNSANEELPPSELNLILVMYYSDRTLTPDITSPTDSNGVIEFNHGGFIKDETYYVEIRSSNPNLGGTYRLTFTIYPPRQ